MEAPRTSHWEAVIRILQYLKKFPGCGILYKKNGRLRIEGFTDIDWAGSPFDKRFLGGNLVTWKSKKQTMVV